MNTIIDLPDSLACKQANQNLHLRGKTSSAGKSVSNREQIIATENRIWIGQVDFVTLHQSLRLTARGLSRRLNGRANILRLPVDNSGALQYLGDNDAYYSSAGFSDEDILAGSEAYADGLRFNDGTGFELPETTEPTVSAAASEGSTSLVLSGYMGRHIRPDTRFSINDFLYEVDTNDNGAITFAPPLREDVSEGDTVEVSYPKVQMRLTSDDGYEPFTKLGRWVQPETILLEEEFYRVSV